MKKEIELLIYLVPSAALLSIILYLSIFGGFYLLEQAGLLEQILRSIQ